ncbi:hypothetical protein [Desulfobacter sp.]|uniref:hypothetical protein n=1 Tax=Desulfobacter sp. TaxID=2294 RepID=UPI003D0EB73B
MTKRKSIMLSEEVYNQFQQFIGPLNKSPAWVLKSLLNGAMNRVHHAKKTGVVPTKIKNFNDVIEEKGEFSSEFSDFSIWCALHAREVGLISEEVFQRHIENLPWYVFAAGLDVINLDPELMAEFLPEVTDREKQILLLEGQIELLKNIEKAEKIKAEMAKKNLGDK